MFGSDKGPGLRVLGPWGPSPADSGPSAGRVRLQRGASLYIEGLRAEDQGWYECRVLFLDRTHPEDEAANGSWVHLTVNCACGDEEKGSPGMRGQSPSSAPKAGGIRQCVWWALDPALC